MGNEIVKMCCESSAAADDDSKGSKNGSKSNSNNQKKGGNTKLVDASADVNAKSKTTTSKTGEDRDAAKKNLKTMLYDGSKVANNNPSGRIIKPKRNDDSDDSDGSDDDFSPVITIGPVPLKFTGTQRVNEDVAASSTSAAAAATGVAACAAAGAVKSVDETSPSILDSPQATTIRTSIEKLKRLAAATAATAATVSQSQAQEDDDDAKPEPVRPALEDPDGPQVTDDGSPFLQPDWFSSRGVAHPWGVRWSQSLTQLRVRIRPATSDVAYLLTKGQVLEYNNEYVKPPESEMAKPEVYSDNEGSDEDNVDARDGPETAEAAAALNNNNNDDDDDDNELVEVEEDEEVQEPVMDEDGKPKYDVDGPVTQRKMIKVKRMRPLPKIPKAMLRSEKKNVKKKNRVPPPPPPELPFRATLTLHGALLSPGYRFFVEDGFLVLTGSKVSDGSVAAAAKKWPSLLAGAADKKVGWIAEEAPTMQMLKSDQLVVKKRNDSSDSSDDEQ